MMRWNGRVSEWVGGGTNERSGTHLFIRSEQHHPQYFPPLERLFIIAVMRCDSGWWYQHVLLFPPPLLARL